MKAYYFVFDLPQDLSQKILQILRFKNYNERERERVGDRKKSHYKVLGSVSTINNIDRLCKLWDEFLELVFYIVIKYNVLGVLKIKNCEIQREMSFYLTL